MKIFIACLGTETNTFSPTPTGLRTFEETMLFHGDATAHPPSTFSLPLHRWRALGEDRRANVAEGLAAFAQPGGVTVSKVYDTLRSELLAGLMAAGSLDIVLLAMHGAMVAEECDDCEGDILENVRSVVGSDTVIGAELDLHCSITRKMTDNADALVLFKEYPHIDVAERADELFEICWRARQGDVKPVMAVYDCRMISMWRTPIEPMKSVVAEMRAAERERGVLSVSFAHGFPWGDVPDASAKVVVISDGDGALAASTARRFGERIWSLREQTANPLMAIDDAVDAIASLPSLSDKPAVFADTADNAGGGAPSDSTLILAALLERGVSGVLSGYYWDPIAVRFCEEAGEGATLDLRVGGKCGPGGGAPVDLTVTVQRILEGAEQTFGDAKGAMGTAVWLSSSNGVDLVLTTKRTQVFHPDGFAQLGIDLTAYRAIVLKSMQHFYAGFVPIASRIEYVGAPGPISRDFASIDYKKFTAPYWPKVADPFAI